MKSTIFITGTDTGVGKTVVSAGLAQAFINRGIDIGVMKPVATGCPKRQGKRVSEDVEYLMGACDFQDDRDLVCPYMLRDPLAPEVAAEREGARIDVRRILRAFRRLSREHEVVIVEGAGGLFVPLKPKYFMLDLAVALDAPVIVVARPGLGTINHTLLTCEAARGAGIEVAGIVINDYVRRPSLAERTNPDVIRRYAGVRLLGIMPRLPGVSVETGKYDGLLEATEKHLDIGWLLKHLRRTER